MTNRTAYIIMTDDGIDQIVEGKAVCAREMKDLREMGCAVYVVPARWSQQDAAVALIEQLLADDATAECAADIARGSIVLCGGHEAAAPGVARDALEMRRLIDSGEPLASTAAQFGYTPVEAREILGEL